MNKLDREVAQVCDRLTDKGARGVILLIVEPDGVHENGVVYGFHAEVSGGNVLLRTLIEALSGAFKRLLHHLLGSDRKGGRV